MSLDLIRDTVRMRTGLDITQGSESHFQNAVEDRMEALNLSAQEYYEYLQSPTGGKGEWNRLVSKCTNNESFFFREEKSLRWLLSYLPRAEKPPHRVWSAGCAKGEEPYTLGILAATECESLDLEVVGSDIDIDAVRQALDGSYRERALRSTPEPIKEEFFEETARGYRLNVRRLSRVGIHLSNLMDGRFAQSMGPFSAVLCRYVLMYLEHEAQQQIVDRFWEALKPGGVLLLSSCESLVHLKTRFKHEFEQPVSFYRKEAN